MIIFVEVLFVFCVSDAPANFNFQPYVGDLYQCTLRRLKAADIDQEVKERAISCMYVHNADLLGRIL